MSIDIDGGYPNGSDWTFHHQVKTCTKCGQEKILEDFYRQRDGKYGRHAACKVCRDQYEKNHYT